MAPSARLASAMAACTWSASPASAVTNTTCAPGQRAATACRAAAPRSESRASRASRRTPASMKRKALARPTPEVPPAMTTADSG